MRFITRSNRLELKYERAFTLAVLKNNSEILSKFPARGVKPCLVKKASTSKDTKLPKKLRTAEETTTPLHLACRVSNEEAVKLLVERHAFNPNMILHGKTPIFELL